MTLGSIAVSEVLLLLKIGFLVLLYLFIWRVVRTASKDLRGGVGQESMILAPQRVQEQKKRQKRRERGKGKQCEHEPHGERPTNIPRTTKRGYKRPAGRVAERFKASADAIPALPCICPISPSRWLSGEALSPPIPTDPGPFSMVRDQFGDQQGFPHCELGTIDLTRSL